MLKQTGRPKNGGGFHSPPANDNVRPCLRELLLSTRSIDRGEFVIDAFDLFYSNMMLLGQEPRQLGPPRVVIRTSC